MKKTRAGPAATVMRRNAQPEILASYITAVPSKV
jgi:hypothetical protein